MAENTTKFSKIRETKAYDETTLYSSSISFLKIAYNDILNIEKYPRECFGTPLLKQINGIIHIYKNAYKIDDVNDKISKLTKLIEKLDVIGTDIKILKELDIITEKQYGVLITKYGSIMTQTVNFCNSLKKQQ